MIQLEPLPYHVAVADHLERAEPELWRWFGSDAYAARYREQTATDLLRAAVRLESKGANERRHRLAGEARDKLGLAAPVTLYQMHDAGGSPNAHLVFVAGEIVVAFSGRILELLDTDAELLDLLGHEMAHYKLYTEAGGRFHAAERLLHWVMQRDGAPAEWLETWRRYRLHMEIYCDLGGLVASGDREASIRGLVKSVADFRDADAESYLRQARELMAAGPGATRGLTHPELHVRALALADAGAVPIEELHARIGRMIAETPDLGVLDLIDQQALAALTRKVLDRVLADGAPGEAAVAHARQMFAGYEAPGAPVPLAGAALSPLSASVTDYLAYLLLDLATVDDGGRGAISVSAAAADELGIGARFREIARLELRGRRTLLAGLGARSA